MEAGWASAARIGQRVLSSGFGLFATVLIGYIAGSWVAFWLADQTGLSAVFFPPAGITVAALLTIGRRRWPLVLAAALCGELAMDLRNGLGLAESIGFVAANGLEPLAGAALVRWAVRGPLDLSVVRHLLGYLGGAVVGGPAAGAALNARLIGRQQRANTDGVSLMPWRPSCSSKAIRR